MIKFSISTKKFWIKIFTRKYDYLDMKNHTHFVHAIPHVCGVAADWVCTTARSHVSSKRDSQLNIAKWPEIVSCGGGALSTPGGRYNTTMRCKVEFVELPPESVNAKINLGYTEYIVPLLYLLCILCTSFLRTDCCESSRASR